jgi:predicted hotdog family 3-hydroxylacyl-ACP dehydratase
VQPSGAGAAILNRAAIEALIPHKGDMCLLDRVVSWDRSSVVAIAGSHRRADHPLRVAGRLPALCGIEYAAQAMALHRGLCQPSEQGPAPGVLASIRDVTLNVVDLDEGPADLQVEAIQLAGDQQTKIYRFRVMSGDRVLVEGRASVVTRPAGAAVQRMGPGGARG